MSNRTTIKTLRMLVDNLNLYTGNPTNAYKLGGGSYKAIPGVYVLDCAYGGYRLCQMVDTGGEQDITPRYPAGITADLIRAYTAGIRAERKVVS